MATRETVLTELANISCKIARLKRSLMLHIGKHHLPDLLWAYKSNVPANNTAQTNPFDFGFYQQQVLESQRIQAEYDKYIIALEEFQGYWESLYSGDLHVVDEKIKNTIVILSDRLSSDAEIQKFVCWVQNAEKFINSIIEEFCVNYANLADQVKNISIP